MSDKWTIEQFRLYQQGKLGGDLSSPKKPKYNNKKVIIDCLKFDSVKEGNRYSTLKLLEKAGEVKILGMQVPFILPGNIKYMADFVYINQHTKQIVVEDVKSEATRKIRTYINKKKQMKAIWNIEIHEI